MDAVNLNHFKEWLQVFFQLRENTDIHLDRFINRLSCQASQYPDISSQIITNYPTQINTKKTMILNRVKKFGLLAKFIAHIPLFMQQMRKMAATHHLTSRPDVIVALASNRLYDVSIEKGVRHFIAYLMKPFSVKAQPLDLSINHIQQDIESAPRLFVCDPLRASVLWKHYKQFWNENVFILDVEFLVFQSLIGIFKGQTSTFFKAITQRNKLPKKNRSLVASLILDGYRISFGRGKKQTISFFLTSNSIATEILRFYLLQVDHCQSVCEIMHGIPAIFYEKYLADVFFINEKYHLQSTAKHSSISKIPNLPMCGVLKQDVKCGIEQAINSYFNYYILNKQLNLLAVQDVILNECNQLFSKLTISSHTLILTFIGGVSVENDFFSSQMFHIEKFMMKYITNKLSCMNQNYMLIYAPHPAYPFEGFAAHPFFLENRILTCQDTILTWLLSDLSFSLFSAALFEATLFGVSSFTPIEAADQIFPPELLDFLANQPAGRQHNFVSALDWFIENHYQKNPEDLLSRAENRLKLFYSPCENSVLSYA